MPERADMPLPGLEHLDPDCAVTVGEQGDVEAGVRRTLAALDAEDRLHEVDAGRTAVAISLSRIIAAKERTNKLSTVSNDARLLIELLDSLAGDEGDSTLDARLVEKMTEWEAALDDMAAQPVEST